MNTESIKELLRNVPLFVHLTDEELQPILNITQTRTFKSKSHVFYQGDELGHVYFIHSGKIKIYKTDINGKEQIVSILKRKEMFPHAGFFRKGGLYPAHAEAIEDTTLFVIPIVHFENIIVDHPEVSIKLFRVMGEKIVDLQNRLEEQILLNTYEQIIKLILRLSKTHGNIINEHMVKFTSQFTNRELANMIGSSRETVSRTINQLKKKNLITLDKEGFYTINFSGLENELF